MISMNGYDHLDLYSSVKSILRSWELTPKLLADFIYNRRRKFVGFPYRMTDFAACECQFKSLINQDALAFSKSSGQKDDISELTSEKISEVAELAFGLFATWTWESVKN